MRMFLYASKECLRFVRTQKQTKADENVNSVYQLLHSNEGEKNLCSERNLFESPFNH